MYNKVGKREVAEDLTSQVFLKVVSSIDYQRSRPSMQQWLYLITRTTLADHWRTHYRLPSSSLDELIDAGWEGPVGQELAATSSSTAERVHRIMQTLPERYRVALKCRFLLKLSLKATAQKTA